MRLPSLVAALIGATLFAACGDRADPPATQPRPTLDGVWVNGSGTTEVGVRAIGGEELELRVVTVLDRKDRRQDQVRLHVVKRDGSQLLLGAVAVGHVDQAGSLVYLGRPFTRANELTQ